MSMNPEAAGPWSGWSWIFRGVACFLFLPSLLQSATLTRREAVEVLLAAEIGSPLVSPTVAWSPFEDFGFGPGREGLLPAGSHVQPRFLGLDPWPGTAVDIQSPSYLFWVDDEPAAEFMHATRFLLVAADPSAVTPTGGRVLVSSQGWWPVVRLPSGRSFELWATAEQRASDAPPGFANPDGLVFGDIPLRSEPAILEAIGPSRSGRAGLAGPPPGADAACALIVRGAPDAHMSNNVVQFRQDLIEHFGVSDKRILISNKGGVSSCADLVAAIKAVCELDPPCSRIYVRITSHRGVGCLVLGKDCVPARELCTKLGSLGAKGVPIHMLINACYSFSLVDTNNFWSFAAGSTVLTSANANRTSYGGKAFSDPDGNGFAESLYAHAFSKCLRNGAADQNGDGFVDDCEAHEWVKSLKPPENCYPWKAGRESRMLYPANTPKPYEIFDPNPQKAVVKDDPRAIGIQVQNGTGKLKSDFHMIFQGDVRGGKAEARRADGNGAAKTGDPWGKTTITFNPASNETMVCWDAPNDQVRPNDFMILRYGIDKPGLRFLRGYWTPTTDPPADEDKIPTKSASLDSSPNGGATVRQLVRDHEMGGWGLPWLGQIGFAALSAPVALENLDFSNLSLLTAASNRLGNTFLLPNQPVEMPLTLPALTGSTEPTLVFISQGQSPMSPNRTLMFEVFRLSLPLVSPGSIQPRRIGGDLEILWTGTGVLQSTGLLDLPWQNVSGNPQGSYRVPLNEQPIRFFRLAH